jgi:exonuclease III
MAGFTTYLSLLTLNVNVLNSPIKRHHLAKWIKKEELTICCLQETGLIGRNKQWLRVKDWKKIYQVNGPPKQAGVAILISDKVDFKLTLVKGDKEGCFILIKSEIHQKEVTIINLYARNVSAPNFVKYTLRDLKSHIDPNMVVEGDFNTHLSPIDGSSRQKVNKEILDLNDTIDQMDLTDVYRTFYPATAQYTFFLVAHGTFSKIDHILLHKTSLSKYKKIEIIPCILSDHNIIKQELNNKSSSRNYANN